MVQANKSELFRSKGLNIIKNQKIDNMTDFLNDPLDVGRNSDKIIHLHPEAIGNDLAAINNKVGEPSFNEKQKETLGRLHIQIRQDLIEKLLGTVFERKRNPRNRGASQRAVIEEALENYFKNE
jgi:hypothetical protein